MISVGRLVVGAILLNLGAGIGCSASAEDGTDDAYEAQGVTKSNVTPDEAIERVVDLLDPVNVQKEPFPSVYHGVMTGGKECQVTAKWYEASDFITVSTTETVGATHRPVGEPLTFEILGNTSYRTDPSNPNPQPVDLRNGSKISNWKEREGATAFTVQSDGKSGPITADISILSSPKSGLKLKTTIGGRTLECKALFAEGKSSGE